MSMQEAEADQLTARLTVQVAVEPLCGSSSESPGRGGHSFPSASVPRQQRS